MTTDHFFLFFFFDVTIKAVFGHEQYWRLAISTYLVCKANPPKNLDDARGGGGVLLSHTSGPHVYCICSSISSKDVLMSLCLIKFFFTQT